MLVRKSARLLLSSVAVIHSTTKDLVFAWTVSSAGLTVERCVVTSSIPLSLSHLLEREWKTELVPHTMRVLTPMISTTKQSCFQVWLCE